MRQRRWGGLYGFVWWMFALTCVLVVAVAALSAGLGASTRAANVATCVNESLASRQQSSVQNTKASLANNEALLQWLQRVYALTTRPRPTDPAEQQRLVAEYEADFKHYLSVAQVNVAAQQRLLQIQQGAPLGRC